MAGHVRRCFKLSVRAHPAFAVQIVKVLGEGGFSFVYLAQDEVSGVSSCHALLFALPFSSSAATIRVEDNTLSNRLRRCQTGYARSGGLQTIQVRVAFDTSRHADIE